MPPHRTQKQKVKVKVVITAAEDDPIVSKRESLVEATIYSRKEALRKISRRNHYLRIPPCAHTRKHRERQAAAPSPVMEMIEDILGEVLIWPHINAIRWVDNVVWIFRMIKAELVARMKRMEKTMEALSNVWGLNHKTGNSWRKKVGEGPDWMAIRNQLLDDIYEPWSIDQKATWIEEMLENIKMTMDDEVGVKKGQLGELCRQVWLIKNPREETLSLEEAE